MSAESTRTVRVATRRAVRGVVLAWAALLLSCGPPYGKRCASHGDCGGTLHCNGDYPLSPLITCESDGDCAGRDGAPSKCTEAVLNGVTYPHVCVHQGTCVSPEETRP